MSRENKKVVIVGGGFGGINVAKILGNQRHVEFSLIDRRNYHLFQPLLYQVAMAGLSPAEIAFPIRALVSRYKNGEVILGEVQGINPKLKTITTDFGDVHYDYLVLACGSTTSYFGHNDWEPIAPGLKTIEQATEIRRKVLLAFEIAEREKDPEKQRQCLTFVVVGGGPTGVELAGSIGELSRFTLAKDFRHIDPRRTRIVLIEAGNRILPSFDPDLSQKAVQDLEQLGVSIWTSTRVMNITENGVELVGGEELRSKTVIWAAGVGASSLNQQLGSPTDKQGRLIVEADLSLTNHSDIFVIGDQAHFEENGKPLPGLAPVAMQQGRHVARNILRLVAGKQAQPFRYLDKGQMATIGRRKAIAESGKLKLHGILAWYMWLVVHIYYLIGVRNRIFVFFQWVYAYVTFRKGARLVVGNVALTKQHKD